MINALLSWIFARKIKLVYDITWFYKFRNFSNGISGFNLDFDADFYLQSHNPKMHFRIAFLNYYLLYFEIYNIYHLEEQQRVDRSYE